MRIGLHLLTKAGNQFFGLNGPEREHHVAVWRRMGVTDVKLVTDGDSQLKAAQWLVGQGFRVLVRFYHEPICVDAVPDDQLKLFRDAGVWAVEGYTNEPEIEWGKPPTAETIDTLAHAHIRFADACGRVGIKPVTPAIQGDRVDNWFVPMINRIIEVGRKDALEGSLIGVHPRPANNPPLAAPPGFVARSYERFDDAIVKRVGHSLDMLATEWGYEPGDSQNREQPAISYNLHAHYNVALAQARWRPCLQAAYYWTWLNDWSDSGWWRGDVVASLPVVASFIGMAKPSEPVTPPVHNIDADLRAAWQKQATTFPWGIKEAYRRGYIAWGDEVRTDSSGAVWFAQPVRRMDGSLCLLKYQEGHFTSDETTEITM